MFDYLGAIKPRYAVLAAARVGGILANSTYPVDFLSDNLRIQVNVLDAAQHDVEGVLFLGSSCIYPKLAAQPIVEDSLLTGHLEPTNDAYAIAKIAGIMQVQAVRRQYGLPWISAMPTNLYGPNDNFSPTGSHVLPALIRRYDEAAASGAAASPTGVPVHRDGSSSTPTTWPMRACICSSTTTDPARSTWAPAPTSPSARSPRPSLRRRYAGRTEWDTTKPDGTPQKLLDVSKLAEAGWTSKIGLQDGLERTVAWYREHVGLRG